MSKTTEQMFVEDQLEAVRRILTAPMPVVGNWEKVYRDRIDYALKVIDGRVHPGDVNVAPQTIEDAGAMIAAAFRTVDAALK